MNDSFNQSERFDISAPKYRITWKTFALPLVGLTAFFAYVYIFQVDIQEIVGEIAKANSSLFLIAAVASVLDTVFFAFAWRTLLNFLKVRLSVVKSLVYTYAGLFLETLIPAESISGELLRIFLVDRDQNGTAGQATASVVTQRLIGMIMNIGTLIVGAVLLLIEKQLSGTILYLILFLVTVTSLFSALLLLFSQRERWTLKLVDGVIRLGEWLTRGKWKLDKMREEAIDATKAFHVAIKAYGQAPKTLFGAIGLSIISWMFSMTVLYFTVSSLGYHQISWSAVLVVSSVFVAVKNIPVGIPFEVGLPEIALSTLLILFGIPEAISFSATILTRLLTLWMKFAVGLVAQQKVCLQLIITPRSEESAPQLACQQT